MPSSPKITVSKFPTVRIGTMCGKHPKMSAWRFKLSNGFENFPAKSVE
jgi:hypothetical protein